jgi:phage baseplate assembly protein W
MSAFGVKVPIMVDSGDGFTMLKTIRSTIKQNFKMLLLTNPGERVMVPDYGVGLKRFLFENYHSVTEDQVRTRITDQVSRYLPLVNIDEILVTSVNMGGAGLSVQISYSIQELGTQDILEFTI